MNFLWFILIGILAGFIAGKLMRGDGFGLLLNFVIGIIGSVLGGWIFGLLGIAAAGIIGNLICAVIGAVVLLWIISLFRRTTAVRSKSEY